MKTRALLKVSLSIFGIAVIAGAANAQTTQARPKNAQVKERAVFVTGSMLPQRTTKGEHVIVGGSAVLIIDRRRIDQTGRATTADVLRTEPLLYVRGY